MKNLPLFGLLIFFFSCSMSNHKDTSGEESLAVHFQKSHFAAVSAKAKQENKLMLMDVYATWCVPCKKLDKTVFSDEEAGEFINSKFVSLKVDGEKGEGPELMKKFGIPGYPTVILFTSEGEEIDRMVGFDGKKDAYLQTIKDYLDGKNTLKDYLSRIEIESNNVDLNYEIATKFLYRKEEKKALTYYQQVVELDPGNTNGHKDESSYQIASIKTRLNNDPQPLQEFIQNSSNNDYVLRAFSSLTRLYRTEQNIDQLVQTYENCLVRFPENAYMMNSYAWDIFKLEIKDKYRRGIEVAKKAVELEPDEAAIWDTLGQLQFAAGNVEGAIEAMQKAVDLEPETASFKENLERYRKSRMKA